MRQSAAAARRGIRFAIATALVAAGVTQLAPAASAAPAGIDRVGYECQATNPIINATLEGHYQFYVTARTDLPDSIEAGETVPATDTTLSLILARDLVDHLYTKMQVRRVRGTSRSDVVLQAVAPGGEVLETRNEKVSGLQADWVPIATGAEITIPANGTVAPVTLPASAGGNGLIYVQMPKVFFLDSVMDPPVLGSVSEAELRCVRQQDTRAARVIGTIAVGNGCSESECPLPAATGGDPTDPDPGTGAGDGTDPEVIDPVVPDEESDVDSDYAFDEDGDGTDDGTVESASAETTELPATGSSFGPALAVLLAALVALRIGLAVRLRRDH